MLCPRCKSPFLFSEEPEWEVAHLLRDLRNDGAHDRDVEITVQDARDALKLLEMLCLSIYTIQQGFSDLKGRREQAHVQNVQAANCAPAAAEDDIPF